MVFKSFEPDKVDQRSRFAVRMRGTISPRLQTEADIAENRTPGEQRLVVLLEQQHQIGRRAADVFAVDHHAPGARRQ